MTGTPDNEQALISAAQNGDLDAFNQLVLCYQDTVFSVAYRIMGDGERAADAAQDAFITAYRRLETYRGGVFRAWLLRIVTNTCYDALRYHKRRPVTALDDLTPEGSDDGPPIADEASVSPEQAALNSELQAAIQNCINGLNAEQRIALVMSDVEGFNYQEIASATGVELGTVKSRLSRARAGLRRCLQAVQELLPSAYRL